MGETLTCAVCGHTVALDMNHHYVTVEKKQMHDRDEQSEFILHDRCADAIFDGWWSP